MNSNAFFGSISMVISLTASSILGQPLSSEYQTLAVPSTQAVSFDRGTYEIIESKYSAKSILSNSELIAILKQAGFSGYALKYAWAVAIKESTARPMAHNKSSDCYGLFQINMSGSLGTDRIAKYGLSSREDLFDPLTNAKIAYQMSNAGKNWSAWSTENSAKAFIAKYPG